MARRKNDQEREGAQVLPDLPDDLRLRPVGDLQVDAWLQARREWERQAGMTIQQWWAAQLAAARATGSLDAVNRLYATHLPDDDDERDWRE